jgi:predicted transcriptional regulator
MSLSSKLSLEDPTVQDVLEIAREILRDNKILDMQHLYNVALRRLDISRQFLLNIIQYLFNKRILVEGSRYSRQSVLLNPYRKTIYELIQSKIGVHFSSIRESLTSSKDTGGSLSSGQLIWHLEMLIKFKLVKKVKLGNYSIFMLASIDEQEGILHFLMNDDINRKIIHLLAKKSKVKRNEMYKEISERREDVYYRINNLKTHEIIILDEDTNEITLSEKLNGFIKRYKMSI